MTTDDQMTTLKLLKFYQFCVPYASYIQAKVCVTSKAETLKIFWILDCSHSYYKCAYLHPSMCVCVLHYEQNIWKGKLAICHSACLVAKADLIGFRSTTFLNNDFLEAYTIYSTLCQGTNIKNMLYNSAIF